MGHDGDDDRKGYHSNRLDELILLHPKLRGLANINAYAKIFTVFTIELTRFRFIKARPIAISCPSRDPRDRLTSLMRRLNPRIKIRHNFFLCAIFLFQKTGNDSCRFWEYRNFCQIPCSIWENTWVATKCVGVSSSKLPNVLF